MTREWQLPDAEDAPCARCEKPVHLAHDAPCPHGIVVCPDCEKPDACPDCRREAQAEMFRSGEYDPVADPFYKPENAERDHAYWTTELEAHTESVRRYYGKGPA